MIIQKRGGSILIGGVGYYAKYDVTGYTANTIQEGDKVRDNRGIYWLVLTVEPIFLGDTIECYQTEMSRSFSW